MLRQLQPASFLFENVVGMTHIDEGDATSPLNMVLEETKLIGYRSTFVHLDLAIFHECQRPRRGKIVNSQVTCQIIGFPCAIGFQLWMPFFVCLSREVHCTVATRRHRTKLPSTCMSLQEE